MSRLFAILAAVDLKTAGWKTYLGLVVIVAALLAGQQGILTPDQVEAIVAAGVVIAGAGKVLADKRKVPEPEVKA